MSFEIFVRPFIPPLIRPPARPPVLPFQDAPEQGVAVLRGLGGKLIDLTFSETSSWSKSRMTEVQRTETIERVKQKELDGTINAENYVDVARMTEMTVADGKGVKIPYTFYNPPPSNNIEILQEGVVTKNPNYSEGGGAAP